MPIQTAEQARRVFKTPRDLTRTKAGRVRREMTDLQRQPDLSKSETGRLKELRRDWNRNLKSTPTGMAISGATSPLDAQNRFMGTTETFRQANPRAYGTMYPYSQAAMKLGEYGGLLGLGIRGLTGKLGDYYKDIMSRDGINGALGTNEAELKNYANLTYGPHLEGIEELDFTDEYEGPWPHDDMPLLPVEAGQPPLGAVDVTGEPTRKRDVGYDITASDLNVEPMPPADYGDLEYFDWVDKYYDTHNPDGTPKADPTVIPGGGTSYVDEFADVVGEEVTAPLSPFDEGKEDFIRRQNEYVSPAPLEIPNPQGDFARFNKYLTPNISVEFGEQDKIPSLPPYQGREFGLGQFMDTMPRDWQDYLEDMQRVGDVEGGYHKNKMTYEEWHDLMRRRR